MKVKTADLDQRYGALRRNLALVSLFTEWEKLTRQLLGREAKGKMLRGWLVRHLPKAICQCRGKKLVSWVLDEIYTRLDATEHDWNSFKQDSIIPIALSRTFGEGALALLPNTKGG